MAILLAACSNPDRSLGPDAAEVAVPQLSLSGGNGATAALVSRLGADRCLTVKGGSRSAGTPLVLGSCNGAAEQQFTWQSNGEIRAFGGALCVDAWSGKGQDGNPIIIWPCNGGTNQKWTATTAGDIKGINGKCIDVARSNTANGAQILLWSCHGNTNQKWDNGGSSPAAKPPAPAPAPAPISGTPIYPGESIQAKVNAAPAGTRFVIKAGTHRRQGVVAKSGNAFIGEPGAILDGENATPYAFSGRVSGVRIQGLVIQNYAPAVQYAAIQGDGSSDWVVESNEIRYNKTGGLRTGVRMRVLRNNIHHNGQIGVAGSGDDVLVEGNEIAYNNYERRYDPYWEAGGTKFVRTRNLVVRGNYSHHNEGHGLQTDIDNINTLYENNRIESNANSGIFHEISYSAVIRNNTMRWNGTRAQSGWVDGAGVLIYASPDVQVYGNTIEDNANGIAGIEGPRGGGAYGAYVVRNFDVHDNTVKMTRGVTGIAISGKGDAAVYTSRNNRFERNRYILTGNSQPFTWTAWRAGDSQWRGYGNDDGGTFSR